MSYFPLDRNLLSSSLWADGSPEAVKVFVYLLLTANPRTGFVEDADPAIALHCGLSIEATTAALEYLASPDPYSRTKEHDGRRIARLAAGGFEILNYLQRREKDYSTPRVKRWRERQAERAGQERAEADEVPKRRSSVTGTTDTNTNTNNGNGKRLRPRRHRDQAATEDASRFVEAFNRTFGRRVTLTSGLARGFAARVAEGYAPDLLVSLPVLVDAQGLPDDLRTALQPGWLLRDGRRGYVRAGVEHPGRDWAEAALQSADRTRLWERHVVIARDIGCLSVLERLGCRIPEAES